MCRYSKLLSGKGCSHIFLLACQTIVIPPLQHLPFPPRPWTAPAFPPPRCLRISTCFSPPTPILRSARNSLDFGSPSHASDNSSSPPPSSPTLTARSSRSTRWTNSTALRNNSPEEHDGSSSLYLAPPSHGHRRKGSVGTVSSIASSSTERDVEDNSCFRLGPLPSAHSDVTSTLPPPYPYSRGCYFGCRIASFIRNQFLQECSSCQAAVTISQW